MQSAAEGTEALAATIAELQQVLVMKDKIIDELRTQLDRLTYQWNELLRQHFGQKSEKQLSVVDAPAAPAAIEDPQEIEFETVVYQRKKRRGRKERLSAMYPRLRIEYALGEDQLQCDCGCQTQLKKIGEIITEQLAIIPEKPYVKQHIRFKYGGCPYDSKIIVAPLLPQPIPKGLASSEIIAYTALNKYADHLPLYRQAVRYDRYGIDISRQTQCDWLREAARLYIPLLSRISYWIRQAPIIHTDDTPIPVQEKGRGKTKTGRLWVYASRGDETNYVLYEYSENRENEWPAQFFGNFGGYIQADAYTGYDRLFAQDKDKINPKPKEVGCWMHARRRFYAIAKQSQKRGLAFDAVQWIKQLYHLERVAKDDLLTTEQRYELRQQKALPVLNEFKGWLDTITPQLLPKSPLAEAVTYVLNQWQALLCYTADGRLDIDNGYAERLLKSPTIGKKNYLFFGNDQGGKTAAAFYTLIQSARLYGLNEFDYLVDITTRLPSHLYRHIDELLPHCWKPLSIDNSKPIIAEQLIQQFLSTHSPP